MTAPTPTPDVVAELAEALDAHSVEDYSEGEYYGDDASLLCLCKFVAYGSDLYDAGQAHRHHLATALAPIVARREAAARAGELRAAREDIVAATSPGFGIPVLTALRHLATPKRLIHAALTWGAETIDRRICALGNKLSEEDS